MELHVVLDSDLLSAPAGTPLALVADTWLALWLLLLLLLLLLLEFPPLLAPTTDVWTPSICPSQIDR
jgi:hypothetical protein